MFGPGLHKGKEHGKEHVAVLPHAMAKMATILSDAKTSPMRCPPSPSTLDDSAGAVLPILMDGSSGGLEVETHIAPLWLETKSNNRGQRTYSSSARSLRWPLTCVA